MKERNIFISHYNKDREQVKRLMDRLEKRPYFNFRSSTIDEDTQIKSKKERAIKEGLRPIEFSIEIFTSNGLAFNNKV